jgi:hypothetical protein
MAYQVKLLNDYFKFEIDIQVELDNMKDNIFFKKLSFPDSIHIHLPNI